MTDQMVDVQTTHGVAAANIELLETWLTWCSRARNRTKDTLRIYRSVAKHYALYLQNDSNADSILDVTVADMEAFVDRPRRVRAGNDGKASPATRRRDAAVLRSFYKWVWEQNFSAEFLAAALHGPTVHNKNPRPIPDGDWAELINCNPSMNGPATAYMPDHLLVMLGLGYWCGLRRDELLNLKGRNIDGLRIVDFRRKGGSEDTVSIEAVLKTYKQRLPQVVHREGAFISALETLSSNGDQALLGFHDINQINRAMRTVCRVAQVGPYTPHQMRHSTATNLLRAGMPTHLVQRVMNHSSIETTMRYVQAGEQELLEWLQGSSANGKGSDTD